MNVKLLRAVCRMKLKLEPTIFTIGLDLFLQKWESCVPQLLAHTVKICIPQPLASRYKMSLLDLPGINGFYSYICHGYWVQSEITKFISYMFPQYYRVGYYGYENSYEIGFWSRTNLDCIFGDKIWLFPGCKAACNGAAKILAKMIANIIRKVAVNLALYVEGISMMSLIPPLKVQLWTLQECPPCPPVPAENQIARYPSKGNFSKTLSMLTFSKTLSMLRQQLMNMRTHLLPPVYTKMMLFNQIFG